MRAADFDLRLALSPCSDWNRRWQDVALPCFLRCPFVQGAVGAMFVEPGSEVVEPALDASLGQARKHPSPPEAKGPECPFDLAVQIRSSEAGLNGDDACLLHPGPELPPELRALVGDDEG